MKPVAKKKKSPNFTKVAVSGDSSKKKPYRTVKWIAVGADVSMSSISLGGIAKTSEGKIRTGAVTTRWPKNTDYFKRMVDAAKAHDIVHELFIEMRIQAEIEEIHFAVEEAVAIGYLQRASNSSWAKQQIQISGAFLGGLLRYGYKDIREIQAQQWQALVAADLGITTHHSKWNPTKKEGKFRAREWVEQFHPAWDGRWPDLIADAKLGLIPKPEGRKQQPKQSDDRYEALAMAWWMRQEMKHGG